MKWAHGGFRSLSALVPQGERSRTRKSKRKETHGENKESPGGRKYG